MPGDGSMQDRISCCPSERHPSGYLPQISVDLRRQKIDGFVINFQGRFYAYSNRCCHIPIPLDWVDNEFFTRDKRHLICLTHGATYEPNTGLCIDGPCPGEYLDVIPVAVKQGQVIVYCPPEWD